MANHYKEVIEFLFFDIDTNYADIVFKIAASHPKIVMDACRAANRRGWKGDILGYRESADKVLAIKLWREKTGLGLKEAKEAVEEFWSNN